MAGLAYQSIGNGLHQGGHSLFTIVMTRDDPYHTQAVHHALHGLENGLKRACCKGGGRIK